MEKDKIQILKQNNEIIKKLSTENQEMREQLVTYDKITNCDDWMDLRKVASILNYKNIGRNKIYALLRDAKWLMQDNTPYRRYIDNGCFRMVVKHNDNIDVNHTVVLVSPKGIDAIRRLIDETDD